MFSLSFLFLSHFFLSHHRLYPPCAFSVSCAPLVITYDCVWVHHHLRFIALHPIYTYNIHTYSMDMMTYSTVNVYIQYISITTLIISVINKPSIIEKIGSLLWPLHRYSTLSASGSDFTGNMQDFFFFSTQMDSTLSEFTRFSGRFTSNMFFFFSKEKE